jgi:hypothetical protein
MVWRFTIVCLGVILPKIRHMSTSLPYLYTSLSPRGGRQRRRKSRVIYESTKSLGKYPKREGKGGRRKRKIDGIPREEEEGKRSTLCDYIK